MIYDLPSVPVAARHGHAGNWPQRRAVRGPLPPDGRRMSVTVLVSPPPALGAFHAEPHGGSAAAMHQSGQDTQVLRHDDVQPQEQPAPRSVSRSIRPEVPAPTTVLIVEMGSGALLLQGWRDGPSAYVSAEDAGPLRQALAAAYGSEHPVRGGARS
ncbi:MAG: hypothetical protein ACRDSP_06860 [Pseudonocardiaceae bacterium]